MNDPHHAQEIIGLATLLLAAGMWLLLPRGAARGRPFGAVLLAISLGLFSSQVPRLGNWAQDGVFYTLAAITVISAAATVTLRSPVYCAVWFALSLLGAAGLFLFQGAQFLGVATIVVYAGAILVTFLFVLMLAQPQGFAFYDRLSWEALLSAATGSLLVGILTLTVTSSFTRAAEARSEDQAQAKAKSAAAAKMSAENEAPPDVPPPTPLLPTVTVAPISGRPVPTTASLEKHILADEHVARLGAQLFSRHLIAVEVAGTLLLVALVGTIAIVTQHGGARPTHSLREGVNHG